MLPSVDPVRAGELILGIGRRIGGWLRLKEETRKETLAGVSTRPWPNTPGFKDRGAELQQLGQRLGERGVIWVTGPTQAGKTWLVSQYVCAKGLEQRAAWIEVDDTHDLEALLAGINCWLCDKRQWKFNPECRGTKRKARDKIGPLLRVLDDDRHSWVILLDSFERIERDNGVRQLVKAMQQSLRNCTVVVASSKMPGWATQAPKPPEIQLGGIEEAAGKNLLSESGLAGRGLDLDELYNLVGGLPGALERLVVLVDSRGPDAVRNQLRMQADIGEWIFGAVFEDANEDTKKLWAGLSLLPGPVTWSTAQKICELGGLSDCWDSLQQWKLLMPADGQWQLQPLARAVGRANLSGLPGWDEKCGRRAASFYADLAQNQAQDRAVVERELGNILAAADLASQYGESEKLWTIGRAMNKPLDEVGQWPAREQLLRLCHRAAQDAKDDARLMEFAYKLGEVVQDGGKLEEAQRLYQKSRELARQLGKEAAEVESLHQLGWVAQLRGRLEEAETSYKRSKDLAEEAGDRRAVARSLHQLGTVAQRRGKLDEAEKLYEDSLNISRTLPDRIDVAKTKHELGILARLRGQFDKAGVLLEESLKIVDQIGDRPGRATALYEMAYVDLLRGDLNGSDSHCRESLEIAQQVGMGMQEPRALLLSGMIAHKRGDLGAAEKHCGDALEKACAVEDKPGEGMTKHRLGLLAQERGHPNQARQLYEQARQIARGVGSPVNEARVIYDTALLAEKQGDLKSATRGMKEACERFEQMGLAEAARAATDLARLREREGQSA
jgi:tetratricopeptide (TPR) repeat protein